MLDQDSHFLPCFSDVCSILSIVHGRGSGLQQDNGVPVEIEQLHLSQGYKVTYLSWWDVTLQILVDNAFPGCDGAWCSHEHSMLITVSQ